MGRFLWLDATAWTAVATIVALGFGVVPPLWATMRRWWTKPLLRLEDGESVRYSGWVAAGAGRHWYVRVPVYNRRRYRSVRSVSDIEVLLKDARGHSTIPMRLRWAHSDEATAARIAQRTFRLLDVAVFEPSDDGDSAVIWIPGEAGQDGTRIPAARGTAEQSTVLELFVSGDDVETSHWRMTLTLSGNMRTYVTVKSERI